MPRWRSLFMAPMYSSAIACDDRKYSEAPASKSVTASRGSDTRTVPILPRGLGGAASTLPSAWRRVLSAEAAVADDRVLWPWWTALRGGWASGVWGAARSQQSVVSDADAATSSSRSRSHRCSDTRWWKREAGPCAACENQNVRPRPPQRQQPMQPMQPRATLCTTAHRNRSNVRPAQQLGGASSTRPGRPLASPGAAVPPAGCWTSPVARRRPAGTARTSRRTRGLDTS